MRDFHGSLCSLIASVVVASMAIAAVQAQSPGTAASNGKPAATSPAVVLPGYVIGADDVLTISLWKEQELSGEFTVRPDGKISMLLVNEVQAAGRTTEELREFLNKAYEPFIDVPNVSVTVKDINSRMVYITGNVPKPGPYKMPATLNVAQLIAIAGGMLDFADQKDVVIIRRELDASGQPISLHVNYEDISKGRNLSQNNVELKPGDTVVVR
jgi:polysaccharide export outer membrane protein